MRKNDRRSETLMVHAVWFRWLGVAGIEVRVNEQILVIDPFLSRPPFRRMWFGRVRSDSAPVVTTIPQCDFVLVTHAHHDHLMDVPDVIQQTQAKAFGSPNACQLLTILGVPEGRCHEIKVGDRFPLGHFQIEVLPAEHLKVPGFSAGPLPRRLRPPLRIRDYRMDTCFSFLIEVGGLSFLDWGSVCSEPAFPADVLWVNPGADAAYYEALLAVVQPRIILPIHWDDLFRPLSKPVRPYWKPPRLAFPPLERENLTKFRQLIKQIDPQAHVFIPEIFHLYDLSE
jgi:L-ascorbate metabolism protein UlaG (beta-lactamase superfamily)